MSEMKVTEMRTVAKENVAESLGLSQFGLVGSFEFATTVTVEGNEIPVTIKLTAKNHVSTDKTPAYDVDEAVAAYAADRQAAAQKAADKAAEREAKKAAKVKKAEAPAE